MTTHHPLQPSPSSEGCRRIFAGLRDGLVSKEGHEATVASPSDVASSTDLAPSDLGPGTLVSRYVVLSNLGAGGMGVVYAAYDPELDRKVALKLLHPRLTADADAAATSEARARLVREAQALAKLNHPHIVAIHDVGEHRGAVWLAMEYVDGETLSKWSKQRRHAWREVLAVMTPAAQGLSAAHDAGLVHRDIKPDNIMVGADGRVRVMDLGLARALGDDVPSELASPDAPTAAARDFTTLAARVTRAGAVMGTPGYMSPEQFQAQPVDARADVFSFCVTLWEALMGERPFAGDTLIELVANVLRGKVRAIPRDPYAQRVPGWLRHVCLRGLAVEPKRRFASMKELLDALSHGRNRARARKWLVGMTAVAALAALGVGYQRYDRVRRISACEDSGARISEVWNDEARARMREGLTATQLSYAAVTADKVMPFLDAQADVWREHQTRACLMADIEGTLAVEHFGRATWCLDERRIELAALVTELSHADRVVVQKAVTAAASLPPASTCTDGRVLASLPSPPPRAVREQADAALTALSEARTSLWTGQYPEGLKRARTALADAEAVDWPPLSAAARQLEGHLLEKTGAYVEAEATSLMAYKEAAKVQAWDVAASAAVELVYIVGPVQARYPEARVWAESAEVAVLLAGDPLNLREANRLNYLAIIHKDMGAYEEAKVLSERALAILERVLGPEHLDVATSLNTLAGVHFAIGANAEAKALFKRVLTIREKALGPEHPDVAIALNNLGLIHETMGLYTKARELHERALAIREKALGPEHADLAQSLNNLGIVHLQIGSYTEAKQLLERALAIWEKALGRDHPLVANALINLASAHTDTGAYGEAKERLEQALAIQEKALGPEHPDVALSLNNLANVFQAQGAYAEAKARHQRALAIREKALGPEHPLVAYSLANLGGVVQDMRAFAEARKLNERALAIRERSLGPEHLDVAFSLRNLGDLALEQRQHTDALPLLERAVAIYDAHEGLQEHELRTRFSLARALVHTGDPTRALAEARKAGDGFREAGEGTAEELAKVKAFLEEHGYRR